MFGSVEATASTKRFGSLIPPLETRHRVSHDITWDFLTFPFFFFLNDRRNKTSRDVEIATNWRWNCSALIWTVFFFFLFVFQGWRLCQSQIAKDNLHPFKLQAEQICWNCLRLCFFLAIITNQQMSPGGRRALFGVWEWSGDAIANASAFRGQSRIECSYLKGNGNSYIKVNDLFNRIVTHSSTRQNETSSRGRCAVKAPEP